MIYSDILRRAFAGMKSGALWIFMLTATLLRMLVILITTGIVYFGVGTTGFQGMLPAFASGRSAAIVPQIAYSTTVMLAALLALPISLIASGGAAHLSDEVLAGRTATSAQGWSAGLRNFGRVLVITLVIGLLMGVVVAVGFIPLILGIVAGIAGSARGGSPVSLFAGVCCGYLLFFFVLMFAVFVFGAVQSIAIRYAVIGGRHAGDALSAAWKAFRARLKNVFVFSLIIVGITLVGLVILSVVLIPLEFATGIAHFGAAARATRTFGELIRSNMITTPVVALVMLPLTIFIALAWTAFFRQMTGLDVVQPPQPVYSPPAVGYAPDEAGTVPAYPPYGPPMAPSGPGTDEAR